VVIAAFHEGFRELRSRPAPGRRLPSFGSRFDGLFGNFALRAPILASSVGFPSLASGKNLCVNGCAVMGESVVKI
jgi:hypothetical protein